MLARNFQVEKVQLNEDLLAVGALRYRCYRSEGLIDSRPDKIFLDQYDFAESAQVFMVRSANTIVGTIRLHFLNESSHTSATMTAFSDILMPKIQAGLILLDGARFAVDPDLGVLRSSIARQTLRIYANFAETQDVDYGVAAVPEARMEIYHRLYGWNQISEPRYYGQLNKKLVLMQVDPRQHKAGAMDSL
jgi:N-acyl-L-homoserine lactone synthetase